MDKKELTRQTRDRNIAISKRRKKPQEPDKVEKLGLTKEQVKQKLKPVSQKAPKKKEKPKPYYILKPQEIFLAERDYEIIEDLNQSYIEQSKNKGKPSPIKEIWDREIFILPMLNPVLEKSIISSSNLNEQETIP